ncbi:hypothetical protein H4W81_000303 [Nonomuraea africana]|uniref:Uncharacterized protein n=1 Tax=Nonomuraea africana TaxID=46171 RepID=A0ABR9K686_9ACTN|nr:hypothetical protein [Nonomuraea africana]
MTDVGAEAPARRGRGSHRVPASILDPS